MDQRDPDLTDDGIIDLFIGTFAGRQDLYVENGARVVRQPLTAEVVRQAVRHHYAISAYTAEKSGVTHVGAVDFDTDDGLEQAQALQAALASKDVPSLVAGSRRGAHVWVTLGDGWITAGTMHRALRGGLHLAEIKERLEIEVFPKPGEDLAAGALRLPGLPHQKTQQAYPIYRSPPAKSTLRSVIEAHDLADTPALRALASLAPRAAPYPRMSAGSNRSFFGYQPPRDWGPAPSASQILSTWGVPRARPGATVKCPKHPDKHASLTILRDDERVFCGAPACPLHGGGHGVGSVQLSRM